MSIGNGHFFLGTWDEARGEIMSSGTQNITVVLRNATQPQPSKNIGPMAFTPGFLPTELVIDDDPHPCTNCSGAEDGGTNFPLMNNWTETFRTGGDFRNPFGFIGIDFAVDGNRTVSSTLIQILLASATPSGGGFTTVSSASQPVHVRVCAVTFDRPEKPIIGANVTLQSETFSSGGPPVISNLTITDPFSGLGSSSILTGPSGCASFNVTRPGGWAYFNNIKGTITYGNSVENVFLGTLNIFGG